LASYISFTTDFKQASIPKIPKKQTAVLYREALTVDFKVAWVWDRLAELISNEKVLAEIGDFLDENGQPLLSFKIPEKPFDQATHLFRFALKYYPQTIALNRRAELILEEKIQVTPSDFVDQNGNQLSEIRRGNITSRAFFATCT